MAGSRRKQNRFKDRSELLDFLLEVTAATSSTLHLDSLLARLAEIIRGVIPYDLLAIFLYSEKGANRTAVSPQGAGEDGAAAPAADGRGLRIRYSIGHREEVVKNLVIPLDEGITGIAASARMPIRSGDVRSDPRYIRTVDAVRSELAVPMLARNRLVGVIDVQSTQLNAFTEEDSALLQLIASRAASSILNARLFRRVERQNHTLRRLAQLAQQYSSILALDELLGKIASTVHELIPYNSFSILLPDHERSLLRNRFSLRYDERVNLDNVPFGEGITGAAFETREAVLVDDTSADPRYIESTPGIRSELAMPLLLKDNIVGVIDLESERVAFFTPDHLQLLTLLSPLIATAVENARLYEQLAAGKERMERDLEAARQLQSIMLPRRAPDIAGLEIGIGLRPAQEISGDVFDFFVREGGHAVIAFGDVSGKSAAAALYGAMVGGLLRTLTPAMHSPALLMRSLNDALLERQAGSRYLALIVLVWEASGRLLTMANAGTIPPLICRRGEIIVPAIGGVPLGLLADREYDELAFQTESGDVIVLYSDGIQDQHNPGEEDYGTGRLGDFVRSVRHLPAQEIADALFADLDNFTAGHKVFDDQTLIVLKVKPRETDPIAS